jgi:hypothetical protein
MGQQIFERVSFTSHECEELGMLRCPLSIESRVSRVATASALEGIQTGKIWGVVHRGSQGRFHTHSGTRSSHDLSLVSVVCIAVSGGSIRAARLLLKISRCAAVMTTKATPPMTHPTMTLT